MRRIMPITLTLALLMAGCVGDQDRPTVDLSTVRITPEEMETRPQHALESGYHSITVRQVFSAQGPCRVLDAELTRNHPAGYMLRVEAREDDPACGDDSPHIEYTAVLRSLPPGRHQLRVVHIGADGRPLAETVFEHPVVVTQRPR